MLAQCLYTCQINAYTYTRLQSRFKDMASELVHSATSSKLTETDWSKNIEICELVARDHKLAKDVVKAIKKRLGSKRQNTQLYAVMLLEMLMNNIGASVHMQVTETGILPILVKIVKKKSEHPVRERIFLLLDAAQTSLGGTSGRFPQYYSAYYELVSAGVQFPQTPRDIPKPPSTTFMSKKITLCKKNDVPQENRDPPEALDYNVPDPSRILQKASVSLEVLKDVLDAIDTQYPERAKDEFTLDLVEQCSFQKQRIMHLAVNSLDEIIVARAVEINEQLERVLLRHDALLDGRVIRSFHDKLNNHGLGEEEEEAEQLFRRMQKGKACVQPEDAMNPIQRMGLMGQAIPGELLRRPLIRPLLEPNATRPLGLGLTQEHGVGKPAVIIPPPPAKSVERERFFQETKSDSSSGLSGLMGSLSVHSRDVSSSHSGSTEFSDLL